MGMAGWQQGVCESTVWEVIQYKYNWDKVSRWKMASIKASRASVNNYQKMEEIVGTFLPLEVVRTIIAFCRSVRKCRHYVVGVLWQIPIRTRVRANIIADQPTPCCVSKARHNKNWVTCWICYILLGGREREQGWGWGWAVSTLWLFD